MGFGTRPGDVLFFVGTRYQTWRCFILLLRKSVSYLRPLFDVAVLLLSWDCVSDLEFPRWKNTVLDFVFVCSCSHRW